ncbi:MAG: protease Do [Deltaproteobacteria bacterium]|nr:protease Do [Deltaproteobacteria bacterium]
MTFGYGYGTVGSMKATQLVLWLCLLLCSIVDPPSASAFPNPLGFLGGDRGAAAPPARPASSVGPPFSFSGIVRAVKPAVVNISTTQTVRAPGAPGFGPGGPFDPQDPFFEFFRHFFPETPRSFTQRSLGSGVIIDADGYIVTNAHVVKDADKIVVKLNDKRGFEARRVGLDEKSDVALLKIAAPNDLAVAPLGDSDTLEVGDWVLAIGNPFGLAETVTAGIVSALGRVIGQGPYDNFIQTDASINPGNSGGPLIDTQGNVVGINAAIFSKSGGSIGIGFAIPIKMVKAVVEQLKTHGKVVRGWLGVAVQDITPELARSFGLKKVQGALVTDVTPESPADRGGLERGDIIVNFDGTDIDEAHQVPVLIAETKIGRTVALTILRRGEERTLRATVVEPPTRRAEAAGQEAARRWGLTVANISSEVARQLGLTSTNGVVVTDVDPEGPAGEAGLEAGDVITQVNRQPVRDVRDYRRAVGGAQNELLLLVQRQGQLFLIVLRRAE